MSRRLTSRCLGRLAQRLIKVFTGQKASVVASEPLTRQRKVDLVLGPLEQLLPYLYRDDALRPPVRTQANSRRVAVLSQLIRSRNSRERCTTSAAASASYDGSDLSANRCRSPG